MGIPLIVVVVILVIYALNSIKILREYERGVIFRSAGLSLPKAPASSWSSAPLDRWSASPPPGSAGSPSPGRHHPRQRHLQGQRRHHPARHRPIAPSSKSPTTSSRLAVRPDHLALRARRSRARRTPGPPQKLNHESRPSSIGTPRPSASKWPTSKSSRLTCPSTCSAPWPSRPKPSAKNAPRSSTPKASSPPHSASSKPLHLLATQPMTLQLRYLQTLTEIGVEKNTTIVFPFTY